jgi:hypothetical protein
VGKENEDKKEKGAVRASPPHFRRRYACRLAELPVLLYLT